MISTPRSATSIGRVSRWFRGEARATPYLHWFGFRRLWTGPELDLIFNSDNELETRTFIWSTWLELETNGWGGLRIYRNFENLTDDFEIREGIVIPPGRYSYNNYNLMFNAEGQVFKRTVWVQYRGFLQRYPPWL